MSSAVSHYETDGGQQFIPLSSTRCLGTYTSNAPTPPAKKMSLIFKKVSKIKITLICV